VPKRLMGFEPTTFCMASRRSSQLSYSRVVGDSSFAGTLADVAAYYLVREAKGPEWDPAVGRREQQGWAEHAKFMDARVDDGFVLLGGPIGDGEDTLLIVDAADAAEARSRLAADPWAETIPVISSVEPWSVWLGEVPRLSGS
jgi:hypothetical protein